MLDDYAAWLTASGFADRTISARLMAAKRLLRFAGTDDVLDVQPRHVIGIVASVTSRQSRVAYYQHAASLDRFLTSLLGESPGFMVGVPRPTARRGTPRPIAATELAAALAVADSRSAMMMLLAAFAGLRVSEISAVAGEDVGDCIFVRGKGGTDAFIPTHPLIIEASSAFPRRGWWFAGRQPGRHLERTGVWAAIKKPLQQVGSTATPHQLRHFYGSQLLAGGANLRTVQELLRHANLAATQVYTRVEDSARRRAVATLALPA